MLTPRTASPRTAAVPPSVILCQPYVGLHAQALGLAERAGLRPEVRDIAVRAPWRWVPPRLWPAPLRAVGLDDPADVPRDVLVLNAGGTTGIVGAALHRRGRRVVQIQHPRMDPRRFDLVVVNRHDGLSGPNVIVTRTALHRVTPERLAEAGAVWAPRLAHLPRPLVAVLVGGTNGRYRLDGPAAHPLGAQLAGMMRADRVGLALTPSRRTAPKAVAALRDAVQPLGGWVWDGAGDNPYFGLLALADAIVVTQDSVSMVSEAAATRAPVLVAELPGHSRRIGLFNEMMRADGRTRPFQGRLEMWSVQPMDDTGAAATEMMRRLGL